MAKFGLIGNPIFHSKSPALFKAAYGEGEHTYTLIEAPTCKEAIRRFTQEGYSGTNVTAPFKDEAMEYIHTPDKISALLGSTNTIINKEGRLYSYNTDFYGVANTLKDALSKTEIEINAKGEGVRVLSIGAGGAGKAAALAVKEMGMEVYFANRSAATAKPFAQKIGAEYITLQQIPLILPTVDIILYNLSVEIDELKNANLEKFIVFEANYAHPNLDKSGAKMYIDGRYWLYNQAVPAFELFTQEHPNTLNMRNIMGI